MDKKIEDALNSLLEDIDEKELDGLLGDEMMDYPDDITKKRIEKKVMEKTGVKKKVSFRKWASAAAAVLLVCFVSIAAIGPDKIYATVAKIFHFLPGIGITDTEKEYVYVVDNLTAEIRNDYAKATIKDMYCVDGHLKGELVVTINPGVIPDEEDNDPKTDIGKKLREKFRPYLLYQQKEDTMFGSGSGWRSEDSFVLEYHRDIEFYLDVPLEESHYEIRVEGFADTFSFDLIPSQEYENLSQIGSTVTHNSVSITATAEETENGSIVSCYFYNFGEDNVTAFDNQFVFSTLPYRMEFPDFKSRGTPSYLVNSEGKKLFYTKSQKMVQGGYQYTFDAKKEDYPLTLHIPPLSMGYEEELSAILPVPQNFDEPVKTNISIPFKVGNVEITEVTKIQATYPADWFDSSNGKNNENTEITADELKVTLKFTSNSDTKTFYNCDISNNGVPGIHSYTTGADIVYVEEGNYTLCTYQLGLEDGAQELPVLLNNPVYWAEGAYDIPVSLENK